MPTEKLKVHRAFVTIVVHHDPQLHAEKTPNHSPFSEMTRRLVVSSISVIFQGTSLFKHTTASSTSHVGKTNSHTEVKSEAKIKNKERKTGNGLRRFVT